MSVDTLGAGNDETSMVSLRSTLRIADVADFKQECDALLAAAGDALVCDASVVEFIDAAALQYLVALRRNCTSLSRGFEIRTPSAAFSSAVQVSGYAAPLGLS